MNNLSEILDAFKMLNGMDGTFDADRPVERIVREKLKRQLYLQVNHQVKPSKYADDDFDAIANFWEAVDKVSTILKGEEGFIVVGNKVLTKPAHIALALQNMGMYYVSAQHVIEAKHKKRES
jgi:hypothetical protein